MINLAQYQGPTGMLRANHRKWEAKHHCCHEAVPLTTNTTPNSHGDTQVRDGKKELWHPHLVAEKASKGEIVKLEFITWPLGMVFDAGEKMRVRISGRICVSLSFPH